MMYKGFEIYAHISAYDIYDVGDDGYINNFIDSCSDGSVMEYHAWNGELDLYANNLQELKELLDSMEKANG